MKTIISISLIVLSAALYSCINVPNNANIVSPNGLVEFELNSNESDSLLNYSVEYKGTSVVSNSTISINFKGMPALGKGLKIVNTNFSTVDESWEAVWGRKKKIKNTYNQLIVQLEEEYGLQRKMDLHIRVYDEGFGFRYIFPEQQAFKNFKITDENIHFNFNNNHTVWASMLSGFETSQENEFSKLTIDSIAMDSVVGMPLLVNVNENLWTAISEADLTDWAGMYLTGADADFSVKTFLSPLPNKNGVSVIGSTPAESPWRVMMIAESPVRFLETNIIANFNDPCALEDVSWIKPGKSAWDWWWCNRYAPDVDFKLGSNNETMKYFIDFASEMGWEYQLVDWHWYGNPFIKDWIFDPNADITTCNDSIDVPELVKYAADRNVKLLLWLEWNHANSQMDEAFALYEKWGVAGIKIDFMNGDHQGIVDFYHRVVKKAAEHHLLVDFHAAYKPTGVSRTYPNLMTREGILGNEYVKWSSRVTPLHKVTVPFTRGILGEMDFTPGAFYNVKPEHFKQENETFCPQSMGTRCNELAMLVVYESALQVLCDVPYNYRKRPQGIDFLKIVPTTWDNTVGVNGEVGKYITVARKSGNEWFVGCMNGDEPLELGVPLRFLGKGEFTAHIWGDGENPMDVLEKTIDVNAQTVLKAKMSVGGGMVLHIKPKK